MSRNRDKKSGIEALKDKIPEFIYKLYQMLEKEEFKSFITWASGGTEVQILAPKKFEEKVLPHFFRHRHMTSFIRQLNMYHFNKVNKISKERSHMFFRNPLFVRDNWEEMKLIKRRCKNGKNEADSQSIQQHLEHQNDDHDHNPSEDVEALKVEREREYEQFKKQSLEKIEKIQKILQKIVAKNPEISTKLEEVFKICRNVKSKKIQHQSAFQFTNQNSIGTFQNLFPVEDTTRNNNNIFGNTNRQLQNQMFMFNSVVLPSFCSFANFQN